MLTASPGWYSDPLGRFPLRYWDGGAWSQYGWSGAVLLDPRGTEPTPPWTVRLRAAFRFSRTSLLMLVAFLIGSGTATVLGASPLLRGDDLAAWLFVPVLVVAQLSDRARWLGWIVMGLSGLVAAVLLVLAVSTALDGSGSAGLAVTYAVSGIALIVVLVPQVRRVILLAIPIDPRRVAHTVALQFAVLLLTFWAATQFGGQALDASGYQPYRVFDIPLSELPMLVAAFFGVGFFVRRNFSESAARLGLVRPSWRQILVALLLVQVLTLVAVGADYLTLWLSPHTASQLDQVSQVMYGSFGSDILPWLLLAASAGIAEEILFRGALQPRLGLLLTAMLFAAMHTQYGFTPVLAQVLLGGIVLGLLRMKANTTTAIICHVTYDLLAGMSFPAWWLLIALGVQLPVVVFIAIRHRGALRRSLARLLPGSRGPLPAPTPTAAAV